MWLPLSCMECSTEHLKSGGALEDYNAEWIPCEISDDGIYRAECRSGHAIRVILQSLKHELLFESGAAAMLLGFRREAVTSYQVALERFFELGIKVFLKAQGVPDKDVDQAWKPIAHQSERQLGAFLQLYLATFKEPFQNIEDLARLRNQVVHKGYIPTNAEAVAFGRRVYDIIETTQLRFEKELTEPFEMICRQPMAKAASQLYESGEAPRRVDDGWMGPTTMYFPMALSHVQKRESARTFDDAMREIERRLPTYGHRRPPSA